MKDFPETRRVH